MPEFPDPETRNALAEDCRRCPALADCRERITWGNGPEDASVLVVGEAPAAGDPDAERWRGGNLTGLAYTSRRSGRKIRQIVADAGYAGDAYYTNAVKCFPADPDDPTDNREPTAEELANCRPYLVEEIRAVDPVAVLATGKHATKSVLAVEGRELDGFLESVLEPVDCEQLGTTLVPLVHPSYQEVWIGRLGYSREEYVAAIRETLSELRT
ncbi:uracil-DNA glycosylase [Halosimplex carlsbadense 2-9-1]|uniref:Uracil-DNA glycosylase n=1 Tax=Halosimplex carlsbadense 2-9-1 TaxID=797114 RepID=M0CYA3_9EURY|nr:uracil-DNA glycosylase family protein [Halosimplex carlsbadense]ELZ28200.1 uracil-DNA glycosylase [Halosimplex carlsbadense 2-9-1]